MREGCEGKEVRILMGGALAIVGNIANIHDCCHGNH